MPADPSARLLHNINSYHEQNVNKSCKQVKAQSNQHCLAERMETLLAKLQLTLANIDELEQINLLLTKILDNFLTKTMQTTSLQSKGQKQGGPGTGVEALEQG